MTDSRFARRKLAACHVTGVFLRDRRCWEQRLDVTGAGFGEARTLLDVKQEPGWANRDDAGIVAASLGFDSGVSDVVGWDGFDAVAIHGEVIALVRRSDHPGAEVLMYQLGS